MTLVSQLSFRDMYHRGCFFAMNDYLAELLEAAKIGADGAMVLWGMAILITKQASPSKSSLLRRGRETGSFLSQMTERFP